MIPPRERGRVGRMWLFASRFDVNCAGFPINWVTSG